MFHSLPDNARIWVFIPDRELTDSEKNQLVFEGMAFISQWNSHGKPLNAQCETLGSAWILAADEREVQASGCSMDKINLFVKAQGAELRIDFFNRMKVLEYHEGQWCVADFQGEKADLVIHSAIVQLKELRGRV
jgi:hypothetical protein